jgi:hypothetical protein
MNMLPFIKPRYFEQYDLPPSWQDDTDIQQSRIRSIKIAQSVVTSICLITPLLFVIGTVVLIASTGKL